MLANPFNWRVRWPRPARVPLFSLGLRYLEVHVATAGGWLTRYRPREVRISIYRYRKIHIDYRSKFLYRFISPTSIIYGNTSNVVSHWLGAFTVMPGMGHVTLVAIIGTSGSLGQLFWCRVIKPCNSTQGSRGPGALSPEPLKSNEALVNFYVTAHWTYKIREIVMYFNGGTLMISVVLWVFRRDIWVRS